jgi:hypothetical protein
MSGAFTTMLLYIDPGSGSYVVQLIIAGILGAAFYVKMFWHKIKSFFGGNKPKDDKPE